jgi:hypothetical protein
MSKDPDALLFAARTAERIGRLQDAVTFATQAALVKTPVAPELIPVIIHMFTSLFESNASVVKFLQDKREAQVAAKSIPKCKMIDQALTKLEKEQYALRLEYEKLMKQRLLVAIKEGPLLYDLLKSLADGHRYVINYVQKADRAELLSMVKDSYEKALQTARSLFGVTSLKSLQCTLNFCTFQYRYLNQKDEAVSLLFQAYGQAMREIHEIPPDEHPEIVAVMELMRSNLASWS